MKNSRLYRLLSSLKEGNDNELEQFIIYAKAESTIIKKKEETLVLLDVILEYYDAVTQEEKDKKDVFEVVEKKLKKTLKERERNDLMSHLVHTIEEWLIIKELRENSLERNSVLVMALKKRNSPKLFESTISRLLKELNKSKIGSIEQYFFKWRILHYQYFSTFSKKINKQAKEQLQNLIYQLNEFWITATYRYTTEATNRTKLFQESYELSPIEDFYKLLPRNVNDKSNLAVQGYELLLKILKTPNNVFDTNLFNHVLDWNVKVLEVSKPGKTKERLTAEKEELLTINNLIINYYYREVLKGDDKQHLKALFQLFKNAEKNGLFLEGATISSHIYIMMIKLSIASNETTWRDDFILRNKKRLIKSHQKIVVELSQLIIDFGTLNQSKQMCEDIRESLLKLPWDSNCPKDEYFDILCRILETKILYQLSLFDSDFETTLRRHIDNFQSFLNDRKKVNKSIVLEANLSFLKIVRKLIPAKYKSKKSNYKQTILELYQTKFEFISERVWLETVIANL